MGDRPQRSFHPMESKKILLLLLVVCCCASELFVLEKQNLIPEGLEYYEPKGFFVSSIGLGQVHTYNPLTGALAPFSNTPRLVNTLGLQVDVEGNRLYTVNTISPTQMSLISLRLDTGAFVREYNLTSLGVPGLQKYGNDVTSRDKDGNVYVTDSAGGYVYRVNLDTGDSEVFASGPELEPTDYFYGDLGLGVGGIVLYKNDFLVVACFSESRLDMFKISLSDSKRKPQRVAIRELPSAFPAIDGLYFRENGNLLAVAGNSVLEMQSTDKWATARVVKELPVSRSTPTSVVEVEGSVFVLSANAFLPDVPYFIEQLDNSPVTFQAPTTSSSNTLLFSFCLALLCLF